MKSVKLSDLDWDFSEGNEVELKIKGIVKGA